MIIRAGQQRATFAERHDHPGPRASQLPDHLVATRQPAQILASGATVQPAVAILNHQSAPVVCDQQSGLLGTQASVIRNVYLLAGASAATVLQALDTALLALSQAAVSHAAFTPRPPDSA